MKLSERKLENLKIGDVIKDKDGRCGYIILLRFQDKYEDGHLGYVLVKWMDNSIPTETANHWSVKGKNKWTKYEYVGQISTIVDVYEDFKRTRT